MPNGSLIQYPQRISSFSLDERSTVFELEPLTNPVFYKACEAAGVDHRFGAKSLFPALYRETSGNSNPAMINLSPKEILKLTSMILEGWVPPEDSSEVEVKRKEKEDEVVDPVVPESSILRDILALPANDQLPVIWTDSGYVNKPWGEVDRDLWRAHMRKYVMYSLLVYLS